MSCGDYCINADTCYEGLSAIIFFAIMAIALLIGMYFSSGNRAQEELDLDLAPNGDNHDTRSTRHDRPGT
jgi:hypothetical protein